MNSIAKFRAGQGFDPEFRVAGINITIPERAVQTRRDLLAALAQFSKSLGGGWTEGSSQQQKTK